MFPPEWHHKFRCILADPPWRFETWSDKNQTRSAPYAVMPMGQIANLPVAKLAADDAILFLWGTSPLLPTVLSIMECWGFSYKTFAFTWAKKTKHDKWHIGLGYWTRANTEYCLLGTRGKPKRLACDVRQLIVAPVREHSRKPDEQYERIERLCDGPRIELFARHRHEGWSSWGDEIKPLTPASDQYQIQTATLPDRALR